MSLNITRSLDFVIFDKHLFDLEQIIDRFCRFILNPSFSYIIIPKTENFNSGSSQEFRQRCNHRHILYRPHGGVVLLHSRRMFHHDSVQQST